MPETFVVSDTHFSHRGIVKFLRPDGTKERPWDDVEEMDEALVANWNSVVGPKDKVYHLGDVVINRSALPILSRLNGSKRLIKGNHDNFRAEEYLEYFKDIRGVHVLGDFVMSHVPVHPNELAPKGRWKGCIHGHLHGSRVMKPRWYRDEEGEWNTVTDTLDPLYLCVSVEQINYTPISFDDAVLRWEGQQC